MRVAVFFLFFVGLVIGFIIVKYSSIIHPDNVRVYLNVETSSEEIMLKSRNPVTTVEDIKKMRILCFLNTSPAKHGERSVHVHQIWGKHCDKLFFASM